MAKKLTLPKLLEKTQKIVNAWIRERDKDQPCISCGRYNELQAGHYVPVRGGSFLRFHPANINGECQHCNGFDQFHLVGYRKNLIKKVGIEMVEYLEANRNTVKKWTREELIRICLDFSRPVSTGGVS